MVFLGAALPLFVQYSSFIRQTYTDTLNRALAMTDSRYPMNSQLINRFVEMATSASVEMEDEILHRETITGLLELTSTFDLAFIYLVQRHTRNNNIDYYFLLSTYDTPGVPATYSWDDAPPEITEVFATGRSVLTEFTDSWGSFVAVFLPVIENGEVIAVWGAEFSLEQVNSLRRASVVALILAIIFSCVIAIVMAFIATSLLKPINLLTQALSDIANGNLSKRLPEKGRDEIANASRSFNQTMGALGKMITVVKQRTEALSDIGNNLAGNMNETATAVNQITANVNNIKDRVATQSASVAQTSSTMEQLVANVKKLGLQINDQSAHVSNVSSAVEEMVANIRSVTDTLIKNEGNVRTLLESSDIGRSGLQNVVQDIQEIARESEGLLEINAVMENIASQTSLLSMNAAIEAAHAGDAGRGFAVVADEIRKLAESSSEQSKTIGAVLKKMKDSVDNINRSTENVLNKFEAIDTSVRTVAEQEGTIRNSMEEQRAGSKQVLEGISSVVEITQQVSIGSDEMLKGVNEVIQESKNLERATQDINKMTYGTDQIDAAIDRANNISVVNRDNIAALMNEVSRFTVD